MGLFDGISKKQHALNEEIDTQHALATIILGSVYADNWESQEENLVLRQILSKSPIFANSSEEGDRLIIERSKSFLKNTLGALDTACSVLTPPLKATAFAMATEIVFADGLIDPQEAQFIESLRSKLGLSESFGKAVVETFDALYRDLDEHTTEGASE